jgi:hypothetical protein
VSRSTAHHLGSVSILSFYRGYRSERTSDKLHKVASTTVQPMGGHETLLEVNQLKYVSRQLNNETRTLVITYSYPVFEQSVDEVVGFLKVLPVSLHSRLGTLSIQDHTPYSSILKHKPVPVWADLVDLCKATPTIKVQVRLLGYDFQGILCEAIVLAIWARADQDLINKISTDAKYKQGVLNTLFRDERVGGYSDAQCLHLPPNVRLFPSVSELDEAAFLEYHGDLEGLVLPGVKDRLQGWVPIARDMVENGV